MSSFIDLVNQVRGRLPVRYGGTGNIRGYATALVKPCGNRTGSTIALGTVVKLLGTWDDPRVTPCPDTDDRNVLGVVVGYYSNDDGSTLVEAAAPTGRSCAVMVAGTADVLISAAVTRGQFAYVSATDGQAYSAASPVLPGAFGVFQDSAASGLAKVVLGTAALTAGGGAGLVTTVNFIIDGAGSAITTGFKGDISFDFACTINQATLLADQSGSIVLDLWKDTYANFPPTVADTITAAAKPTITTATKSQDSTLTGWTTSIAAGESIRVNVDSITTCQRVTLALKVTRT